MARGRCHIHSPVAGTADIAGPAFFKGLVSANLVTKIMHMVGGRFQLVFERIDQLLIIEIALFNGNPFLKPHMRCNNKFRFHSSLHRANTKSQLSFIRPSQQFIHF